MEKSIEIITQELINFGKFARVYVPAHSLAKVTRDLSELVGKENVGTGELAPVSVRSYENNSFRFERRELVIFAKYDDIEKNKLASFFKEVPQNLSFLSINSEGTVLKRNEFSEFISTPQKLMVEEKPKTTEAKIDYIQEVEVNGSKKREKIKSVKKTDVEVKRAAVALIKAEQKFVDKKEKAYQKKIKIEKQTEEKKQYERIKNSGNYSNKGDVLLEIGLDAKYDISRSSASAVIDEITGEYARTLKKAGGELSNLPANFVAKNRYIISSDYIFLRKLSERYSNGEKDASPYYRTGFANIVRQIMEQEYLRKKNGIKNKEEKIEIIERPFLKTNREKIQGKDYTLDEFGTRMHVEQNIFRPLYVELDKKWHEILTKPSEYISVSVKGTDGPVKGKTLQLSLDSRNVNICLCTTRPSICINEKEIENISNSMGIIKEKKDDYLTEREMIRYLQLSRDSISEIYSKLKKFDQKHPEKEFFEINGIKFFRNKDFYLAKSRSNRAIVVRKQRSDDILVALGLDLLKPEGFISARNLHNQITGFSLAEIKKSFELIEQKSKESGKNDVFAVEDKTFRRNECGRYRENGASDFFIKEKKTHLVKKLLHEHKKKESEFLTIFPYSATLHVDMTTLKDKVFDKIRALDKKKPEAQNFIELDGTKFLEGIDGDYFIRNGILSVNKNKANLIDNMMGLLPIKPSNFLGPKDAAKYNKIDISYRFIVAFQEISILANNKASGKKEIKWQSVVLEENKDYGIYRNNGNQAFYIRKEKTKEIAEVIKERYKGVKKFASIIHKNASNNHASR